jgi:hypothetical protein
MWIMMVCGHVGDEILEELVCAILRSPSKLWCNSGEYRLLLP